METTANRNEEDAQRAASSFDDGVCMFSDSGKVLVKCHADVSTYQVPPTCRVVAKGAFANRNWLETIHLPESLERIEDEAFFYCSALKHADLPVSLGFIGDRAFYCTSLKEVRLSKNLEHIGQSAFVTLSKFRTLKSLRNQANGALADAVKLFHKPNANPMHTWFSSANALTPHAAQQNEGDAGDATRFDVEIGSSNLRYESDFLCELADDGGLRTALYTGRSTDVVIPRGVSFIGDYTMMGSLNMRSLFIPATLHTIGDRGLMLTRPLDRITVELPDGEHMKLYPAPGLPGMYACNRVFKQRAFNAEQLANQCDASLAYTRESPERMRQIVARLDNGIGLKGTKREEFLHIVTCGLDETIRHAARQDDLEVLRMLVRIGAVNQGNVSHAVDIANESGGIPACRMLIEENQRMRGSLLDFLAL